MCIRDRCHTCSKSICEVCSNFIHRIHDKTYSGTNGTCNHEQVAGSSGLVKKARLDDLGAKDKYKLLQNPDMMNHILSKGANS